MNFVSGPHPHRLCGCLDLPTPAFRRALGCDAVRVFLGQPSWISARCTVPRQETFRVEARWVSTNWAPNSSAVQTISPAVRQMLGVDVTARQLYRTWTKPSSRSWPMRRFIGPANVADSRTKYGSAGRCTDSGRTAKPHDLPRRHAEIQGGPGVWLIQSSAPKPDLRADHRPG